MLTAASAVALIVLIAWFYARAQARDRESTDATAGGKLFDLAPVTLPRGYRALGLEGADRSLSQAEQLARHDERAPLVFRFTREPSNDWGGYARDPELLNVVLLPPAALAKPDESLRQFSIARYYSPRGETIPLDSPKWQEGGDERYRWRVLAMNDHFGTDHKPRWVIAMLDVARGVRADLFVWQQRMKQAEALSMLRALLGTLEVKPALAEHFTQSGGVEARLTRLRETNLQGVFKALEPYGVTAPEDGETSFGRGVAVWLDRDRKAVRVLRVLASVPLPYGAAKVDRDSQGRPRLSLVLKPEQYPGPTQNGLPALSLQMLYWNPSLERWQRSNLQGPTMNEDHPLQPVEEAVTHRLERSADARDAVHIVLGAHWFHPPALDDARRIGSLLEECRFWEGELLAGRIIGGEVKPSMLQ